MQEEWKPIDWTNGIYNVSNLGRVKNVYRNRILKQSLSSRGYFKVGLSIGGENFTRNIHDLVLNSFVGKKQINYRAFFIDGNKANISASNLKWKKLYNSNKISVDSELLCGDCEENKAFKFLNRVGLCEDCFNIEKKAIKDLYKLIDEMLKSGIPAKSILERFDLHNSLVD